ncbi:MULTISPECIES: 4'-phosphopantetheinyl transferase superfamily protein [unclassified Cyanobium]|uniref:4'-phosphopantetheinyl transferase family protein n=1 Tax=unclassified Cyanobium TaxID=2627006 RepID=UPI0020CEE10D|nr:MULTISPECIES: 4'-phosphopantetheinyl transferase superfamily protein [unclassified Cyanobium]MCP9936841.1 4'-phosphopantetheinyl transferase superfamily protein [Cyanobium sp. Aljojuca 7A6]
MQSGDSPVRAAIPPLAWPAPGGDLVLPPWPWPEPDDPPLLLLLDRRQPQVQALMAPLGDLLDPGERQRLRRLRRQEDGERFLLGRGALRLILGGWLGCDPAGLVLGVGPHGKPELLLREAAGPGSGGIRPQFNVSHSGDLILLGFHPERPVGVDVEQRRPLPEWEGIAGRFLSPEESERIRALPMERRSDAFLTAWCRLEAGLKARGLGLFGGATSGSGAREDPDPDHWPLVLPEGYVGGAALA